MISILFFGINKTVGHRPTLRKFDGPVGVVEELLPTAISVMAQMHVNHGIAFWSDGFCDEGYVGLFRSSAALLDVAPGTRTDDVFPDGLSSGTPWYHVVQRQFGSGELLSAVLANVIIAP